METFLLLIGFAACIGGLLLAIVKFMEAVWFFSEFRDKVTRSLDRIEQNLRNIKP